MKIGKGNFILKPPSDSFPNLPENEHATMALAHVVGIQRPTCGLVAMSDGKTAYIVRRFDRQDGESKLHQEDFCQLMGLPPRDKYTTSSERCAKVVQSFETEPGIQTLNLFKYFLFSWWCGNGDLHLKNLSLLKDEQGTIALSPAYDLICTLLAIPEDQLALPVQGKRDRLTLKTWQQFAESIGLPEKAALRAVRGLVSALPRALEVLDRSFLNPEQKQAYREILLERTSVGLRAS